jgi:hypothetical protein
MSDERQKDAERKRSKRASERNVDIPKPVDLERRRRLEQDDIEWLMYYYGPGCGCNSPFTYYPTEQIVDWIQSVRYAIRTGESVARAMSRGEGKSIWIQRAAAKLVLDATIRYAILFSAAASNAEQLLEDFKHGIEANDRLAEDYPALVYPVRAVIDSPQKASSQLVSGINETTGVAFHQHASKFLWSGPRITFPRIPGAAYDYVCVATKGLESAVRGATFKSIRPDLAVVDDPDTESTAESERESAKLEKRIIRGIGGLGGQTKSIPIAVATTIQSKISVSAKLTDPAVYPAFHGRRYRYLVKRPTNFAMWERYILMRQDDMRNGTHLAADYYRDNRLAMDLGAEVSNSNRFGGDQLSSLQNYFDEWAKKGEGYCRAELDNDPIGTDEAEVVGLDWKVICKRLNGFKQSHLPPGYFPVIGVDVGKWRLHWTARAFRADGNFPLTIDYGYVDTVGARKGSGDVEAEAAAIIGALDEIRDTVEFWTEGGTPIKSRLAMVDSGYRDDVVIGWCLKNPGWEPIKGEGKRVRKGRKFRPVHHATADRKSVCWGISQTRHMFNRKRFWLTVVDADWGKDLENDRWTTPIDVGEGDAAKPNPRAMTLFGTGNRSTPRLEGDELDHKDYAQHVCAERKIEGVWTPEGDNHWGDSSIYATMAAAVLGVPMQAEYTGETRNAIKKRKRRVMTQL